MADKVLTQRDRKVARGRSTTVSSQKNMVSTAKISPVGWYVMTPDCRMLAARAKGLNMFSCDSDQFHDD